MQRLLQDILDSLAFSKHPVSDKHYNDMTHDNTEAFCLLESRLDTFFHLFLQTTKSTIDIWKTSRSSNAEISKAKRLEDICDIQSDRKPFFSAVGNENKWKDRLKKEFQTYTTGFTYEAFNCCQHKPFYTAPP